jgi:signal transduction histidine kinase/ActR/RegA family two-component response regulator
LANSARSGEAADRLRRDLTEARGHLAATSEVLAVLGRSGSDLDAILGAVVEGARRLCSADTALIYLLEGDVYRVARAVGMPAAVSEYIEQHPFVLDQGSLTGRVGLSRRPGQIEDVLLDESYGRVDAQRVAGFRTVVAAPLLLDDHVVGVLNLWRMQVDPFDEQETTLLTAFAAHAAVAIHNAHLVRALEQRSAELEVASRHKSEFLASMSHELRTPLNAVIGFSEVLLERMFGDINERQEEYLRDILGSGRHLLELLNDILDLSKVEAGAMELERSVFDVSAAIEYSLSMVRERASRHGVRLIAELGPLHDRLYADELRVKQVLVNLLSNAVKFTPEGGSVSVSAERQGHDLVVSVTDTGIGIPPEDQERIFESFQQGSRPLNRQEGTGLGLTLCKRIVELHGGAIWVRSEVGAGSTFGFNVPVATAEDSAGFPARAIDTGEPLVLLVEDDQASLDLLEAYLEGSGYDVTVARDGLAALAAVRRDRPAAVVLDIGLPGLGGWDVLSEIKADPATAATPVVVASVLDDRKRGLALGATDYLVKPVNREHLLAALADALGRPLEPASGRGEPT